MSRARSAAVPVLVAALAAGCAADRRDARPTDTTTGSNGHEIHVHEKHSSALVAWRQDGVSDRIVVHLDAHADFDWLPDETVARMAATLPAELGSLESDPFRPDPNPLTRFGTGNFLYAAARLGILRELVWVVPDGTFDEAGARRRLVDDVLVGRMQMVSEEEARSFRAEGNRLRGTLLGVPVTICTLADLPEIAEPVLLDIDLDFFTVRSALSPSVDASPWILPREVFAALDARGIRAEVATVSLSTMSGSVPPEARWLGDEIRSRLRGDRGPAEDTAACRLDGVKAEQAGEPERGIEIYRDLVRTRDDDGTVWYVLARALDAAGNPHEAAAARARAERIDPLLGRAELFEAERFWVNGSWQSALDRYDRLLDDEAEGTIETHLGRRRSACLWRLGHPQEAIETLRSVVAATPDSADARADLGLLLRDQGDFEGAIEQLGAARRLSPDVASHAFALGTAYVASGRTEEGARELEAAILRRPCYVQARVLLVGVLLRAGRAAEASRHLVAALALQPTNPRLRILARQLRKQGHPIAEPAAAP